MPILNYTTKVDEHKTVSEIQSLLSRKGAASVSVLYSAGFPEAVSFRFKVKDSEVPFKLPCKFDGVRKVLLAEIKSPVLRKKRERDKEFEKQTRRVAWRIVKDWVEAQLALIEAGQAEIAEVFLPYLASNTGTTLYEAFRDNAPQLLAALEGTSPLALPAPRS
jgi:hypothetical protein